jgi:hypothetical protein
MYPWAYLQSKGFQTRYMIAAHLCKDIPHVLEIGGCLTPITQFLEINNFTQHITVIDPYIKPLASGRIAHIPKKFPDFKPIVGDHYAIILMGLDLDLNELEFAVLITYLKKAELRIIEYPVTYDPSYSQFCEIKSVGGFKVDLDITLDVNNTNGHKTQFTKRRIVTLV